MKEQGLPVENYVAPNTLTNDDGEELYMPCSREGQKKLDAKAGNIKNVDDVPMTPREYMDGLSGSNY
tara:strand:+ start:5251 stop:5451 length:201 start_codon:yes stop_codon:yes gene_type:complete